MIRLIVTGACGRMGTAILRLAGSDPDFTITHIVEAEAHPLFGTKIEIPGGLTGGPLLLENNLASVIEDADVVVDFTEANTSLLHLRITAERQKAIVIGTTGIPPEALSTMKDIPGARAVISPNMSIGVNLMFELVERAAMVLGSDYDAEIVEMHHKWKKDAPSGTAIRLRDAVTRTQPGRDWIPVMGRQGVVGERRPEEIGVFSVRGGDVVGEHTVLFSGVGERIEVIHRAYSRENFARGALTAAKWVVKQQYGFYDMKDVLGLA